MFAPAVDMTAAPVRDADPDAAPAEPEAEAEDPAEPVEVTMPVPVAEEDRAEDIVELEVAVYSAAERRC